MKPKAVCSSYSSSSVIVESASLSAADCSLRLGEPKKPPDWCVALIVIPFLIGLLLLEALDVAFG